MKKYNKKLIMSVLTLILTVIALGTTTFAWFSLSTVSKVSNISGSVTAGDGLEVRLVLLDEQGDAIDDNATSWKANLDQGDVNEFIETHISNFTTFDAVTSTKLGNFTKMKQEASGRLVLGTNAEKNEDYLEFGIQFRSQETGQVQLMEIDLDESGSNEFIIDGSDYIQIPKNEATGDPAGPLKTNHEVNTNAKYAARISVDSTVFQYGEESIHINDSKVEGNTFMGENGIVAGQFSYLRDSKGLILYSADNDSNKIVDPTEIEILKAEKHSDAESKNVTVLLAQNGDATGMDAYRGLFVVRIWIEGWDADAYDSIYDTELVVSFKFEKVTS